MPHHGGAAGAVAGAKLVHPPVKLVYRWVMINIATRTDLSDHVASTCGNHPAHEQELVVELLQQADHPAWGTCWEEWLNWALPAACDQVVRSLAKG